MTKRMKLGVIGWYNHDNYGDDRILYSLKKIFSDCDFFVVSGWRDARFKIKELNKCDYILIGGGGFILRDCWRYTDVILNLDKPFGLVGISVEAKHESMREFLETVKERAEFILVRYKESRKRLDYHYKVIVGPDLTFLCPFNIVEEVKDEICGVNLRDWYYWKSELFGIHYYFMKKIISKFLSLEKIYPFTKWNPDKTIEIIKENFKNILPIPLYFSKNNVNDIDVLKRYFYDVPTKLDLDTYSKIRYLVGMRAHSIIFAMQYGIPFISLSYQPKNVSFCSDNGLDILSVDIYDINQLKNKIEYIKIHYDQIRKQLIFQREKNIQDIKYIFRSLLCLIK